MGEGENYCKKMYTSASKQFFGSDFNVEFNAILALKNIIRIKIHHRKLNGDPTKVPAVAVAAVESSGEPAAADGSARKRSARAKKESETDAAAAAPVPGIHHIQ